MGRQPYPCSGSGSRAALLLLAEVPSFGGVVRSALAIIGTTGLLLLAALTRSWSRSFTEILKRPPGWALLALILWGGVSFFLTPTELRGMAGAELLRLVAGGAAFLTAAYALEPRERSVALTGLLFLGCVIGISDFARLGRTDELGELARRNYHTASAFGTHENVGSLLALLFPVSLGVALWGDLPEKPRWAAYAAVLILGFAWIVARCRSAWLGGGVALLLLILLAWRTVRKSEQSRRPRDMRDKVRDALGSPLPILIGALLIMGIGGGLSTMLSQRAASFVNIKEDSSFQTRLIMWEGGARMAAQKPLTGWGLASYPVMQNYWTHLGEERWKILEDGADHSSIAHNFYVQWAAEAGAVGVGLHLLALGSGIIFALSTMGRTRSPLDHAILLGTTASVMGACVDAIASPAYQFHGVYALLWALLGLGASALGEREAPGTRFGPWPYAIAGVLALAGAVAVPLWGQSLMRSGEATKRGTFVLISDPPGPSLKPGTIVTLRAEFTDANGKTLPTLPGTTWSSPSEKESGALSISLGELLAKDVDPPIRLSAVRLTLPEKPGAIVQVMASFTDRYGHAYTADSVFLLKGTKPAR
ncbi:MAG: O-antigen ligase family protein [Armatimonas sp.]